MGILAAQHVKPEDILYHIKSMVDVFTEYGNYEKRSESRSRFLQDRLTPEGLKKVYQEKLSENMKAEELKLDGDKLHKEYVNAEVEKKQMQAMHGMYAPMQEAEHLSNRVICQKQPGLYTVSYHPIGGKWNRIS